ncbi:hydrogenase maturation protease [Neptuniibacter caesariensis]|uniref:Peptidase M52, hydrogen uptake protein n=1 Tax=Neptuniibacter caesariensis TaxID=207954 RepID=A0A7U8C338_NEPCE|nr:hydrogenase maturation protease [Neptuniibacter caesariensis]EAR60618.1 Peptidase M52, hydrogen uptake protein [Oceanospirillum sp. MED92] [Neptuniibacter caesariensis]
MQIVLCFGNEWHGDDGFGLAVYEALQKLELPECTELYFCANNALLIPKHISRAERIIIVDAYQSDTKRPGELSWASANDFLNHFSRNLHDGGVEEFIRHLPILCQPLPPPVTEVFYITVAPVTAFNRGLSPEIEAQADKAALTIRSSLTDQEVALC